MADVTKVQASDGTIYTINDEDDYTKDEIDAMLADKADVGVSYTKAEEDALLADKADRDVTYTKAEVDDLLLDKEDAGTSYTKSETDALLDTKANKTDVEDALLLKADKVDTYTKSETDALLADKADVGDSYTKAEDDALLADKANVGDSYTKAEDEALLAGKADVGSFVGFPDLSNPIYTLQDNDTYTLQHDAWVGGEIVSAGGPSSTVQVFADGVMINMAETYQSAFWHTCNFIPLKAGTVITVTGAFYSGKAAKVYPIV